MLITIIGWYGTETLGDRAILDGILSVINEVDDSSEIMVGSLFPFFTERTFFEDIDIYSLSICKEHISIFDIKDEISRVDAIEKSDLLIIGGGPLDELEELLVLRSCLCCAKRLNIPTFIMGCGMGILKRREYINIVKDIFDNADKIALRNQWSKTYAESLFGTYENMEYVGDPAIISIENYKVKNKRVQKEYIAVNFTYNFFSSNSEDGFEQECKLLEQLCGCYDDIRLIPMHTFAIGYDDRYLLEKMAQRIKNTKISVFHEAMNLYQLYEMYANAFGCVGTRHHSIIMQTILNGNNIIFNYSGMNRGKTYGFLSQVDNVGFYKDRIFDLLNWDKMQNIEFLADKLFENRHFDYKMSDLKRRYKKIMDDIIGKNKNEK